MLRFYIVIGTGASSKDGRVEAHGIQIHFVSIAYLLC